MRAFAFSALLLLAACGDPGPQWKGWVYPDQNDLATDWKLGRFSTFEECQQAALTIVRSLPDDPGADYECGYKCKPHDSMVGIDVCEDTRK